MSNHKGHSPTGLSRRSFLRALIAAGAFGAAGCSRLGGDGSASGSNAVPATGSRGGGELLGSAIDEPIGHTIAGAVEDRILLVVDLQGGNDGLSTLVPYTSGRYYDLRPGLAIPQEEALALDDEVALHPSLARLHDRGITTVEGVGPLDGDLSHFAMTSRWERGDVTGSEAQLRTSFLGRLADTLDDGSPLVGLSIGNPTAHFNNQQAATMALSSPDDLWFLSPGEWDEPMLFQEHLRSFDGSDPLSSLAVSSYRDLLDLAAAVDDPSVDPDWDDPMIAEGGELGWKLFLAADLLAADVGTRVVYVSAGGYDTHTDHGYRHGANLAEVDVAVDGFLSRAEAEGFSDRVLVATISEFGRRVPENENGLDHGSASTMLLAGPVDDRRAGERPALDDLDEDDNLRTAIGFDRYLASLSEEWLGVEAASVLPGEPVPLGLFTVD